MLPLDSYKKILQKRYETIETDKELWNDTKPMIPALKRMMKYGVLSTNSQGGIDTKILKQRPYLDLLVPLSPDDSLELLLVNMLSKNFIIFKENLGLILPKNTKSTIVKRNIQPLDKFAKEKTISKPCLHTKQQHILQYQIPVTKRQGKTISNFTIGWQEKTIVLLSAIMDEKDAIELSPYFYQLFILSPEWGFDTVKFSEMVAKCVEQIYPPLGV